LGYECIKKETDRQGAIGFEKTAADEYFYFVFNFLWQTLHRTRRFTSVPHFGQRLSLLSMTCFVRGRNTMIYLPC
jgi:hypothetical protein